MPTLVKENIRTKINATVSVIESSLLNRSMNSPGPGKSAGRKTDSLQCSFQKPDFFFSEK